MNKRTILLIVVILSISILPATKIFAAEADIIENNQNGIPDKSLYQAILKNIGKNSDQKFTKQEAEKIKELDVSSKKIKSLKGIGKLTNLKSLNLSGNNLKNLKPLKNLKKLKYLNIMDNKLTSLIGIEKLKKLTILYAGNNRISNLKELKHLNNLEMLYVEENKIKSLEGVENLTKLTKFYIYRNQLKTLEGIENLNNLTEFEAWENQLENLKGIENLQNLGQLTVSKNRLTNLNEIVGLKKLWCLEADFNRITELPDLKNTEISIGNFIFNYISEEEFKTKLPEKIKGLVSGRKKEWQNDQIKFQNINYNIELTEPVKKGQMNKNTTRIVGCGYIAGGKIRLGIEDHFGKKGNWYTNVDENGEFEFQNLNLKQFAGKTCSISICYYSEENKEYKYSEILRFKIKK